VPADLADELAIEPLDGPLDATVELPGSKSITNRALVCAALASGRSTLTGALRADDTEAMIGCLEALGVDVEAGEDASTVTLGGSGGHLGSGDVTLDARMSGTTARFVLPLLGLHDGRSTLDGHPALRARPMGDAIGAARALGVSVQTPAEAGHLPVTVDGTGSIAGGEVRVAGDVSSQFLSGLLLAGPATAEGLEVTVTTGLVSEPYVAMTGAVMEAFGATVRRTEVGYSVAPGGYRSTSYRVEPDASAASYFFAAAAVLGGSVRVEGLGRGSLQGDLGFVEVLRSMGCEVELGEDITEVRGTTGTLRGVEVDLRHLSDTAPTLGVVAAFADGPTRVTGIGFIRRKETDRIAAIVTELRRCGVDAEEQADGFVVRPGAGPRPARIDTYDDHRMAMSFAVLGLRVPGTVIGDPGCVAKTFPDFFETLDRLR
jgi:3-phosphoshikimate 1-carboxyvinyltransferase